MPYETNPTNLMSVSTKQNAHKRLGDWGEELVRETYGAALVSIRMFLFLRSWGSGRCCRCFSRELRRSTGEMGEMGLSSMEGCSGSEAILLGENQL